jgi:arachidonate 15-lipoxygenase
LQEQQGYYRYDPNNLDQKGYARLFPYTGEDGVIRYILTKLRENLVEQEKLSQPWTLLLTELDKKAEELQEKWFNISTLLVDCIFYPLAFPTVLIFAEKRFIINRR